ncbi:MAG: hypothetical protein ACTSRI_21095 [Promethearchaeota archaeon]
MNYRKGWSKKRRAKLLCFRNNSRFKKIYQRLVNLNLLKELTPFNTHKYDSRDYFTAFEYASLHKISIKQACLMKRLQREKCPSPEQVMKCCRNVSPEMMTNFVNSVLKEQFSAIPKHIQRHIKKSGILIIDFHQDCYYGDKDNPHVRKSKVKKSTNLFYEYITADLYCKYGCFTIALYHRKLGDAIFTLTKHVLKSVGKTVDLKTVIFDGEFPTIDVLNFLQRKGIKFLARKSRTKRVKEHLSMYYGGPDWKLKRQWRPIELRSNRSNSKKVCVEICPQNIRGEMKTLIKSPRWSITLKYADKLYGKRFNIEMGYRDKHKFQIFTCTKILSTRLLFFLISTLMWNCWQVFLIWVRSLKSYSKDLPREFLIYLTVNWVKLLLSQMFYT